MRNFIYLSIVLLVFCMPAYAQSPEQGTEAKPQQCVAAIEPISVPDEEANDLNQALAEYDHTIADAKRIMSEADARRELAIAKLFSLMEKSYEKYKLDSLGKGKWQLVPVPVPPTKEESK
jgi:hypothetical protein